MEPIKININLKIDYNDDGTATITDKDTGLTITHPVPVGMTPDQVLRLTSVLCMLSALSAK